MNQDYTWMSKLQSLPSSLLSLKSRILKYSLVGKMHCNGKTKGLRVLPLQTDSLKASWLEHPPALWLGFCICRVELMMVLPLRVFVRIVIKQQKYDTVPRISFVQEMIAVFISYWTMHLCYSTIGSKNNCHLSQSPWCRSSIQHTVCVNVLELSLTTKNTRSLEVRWFIPFILQMRKLSLWERSKMTCPKFLRMLESGLGENSDSQILHLLLLAKSSLLRYLCALMCLNS